jgi:6-phosphogluconolactonase
MQFITVPDHKKGTQALAEKVIFFLNKGNKVLWLVPGGSNIPIMAEAMNIIRSTVLAALLGNLTITLTDERYGPVGHPDSNWKQLQDTGVNLTSVKAYPILDGSSLAETVVRFGETIRKILAYTDVIVGQFGMGADGHIAGILPHSPAVVEETLLTAGYESKPFTRISLTFPVLRRINVAYMFVSNATKKTAIDRLHENNVSLDEEPAQILKEIPEVYVYVD